MNLERSIGAGPRRGANEACALISNFVVEIAQGRDYPDVDGIRAGFAKISPTLGVMLTTRSLGEPAISMQMPELQVQISVSYSPDWEDDMAVPSLKLLDKLVESDSIEIILHATGAVHQSLQERLHEASSKHIVFALAGAVPPTSPPPSVPVEIPPAPTLPLDPTPQPDAPSLGAPQDDYLPPDLYVPHDVGLVTPPADRRDESGTEPVIALDDVDDPDGLGYLGRPAID